MEVVIISKHHSVCGLGVLAVKVSKEFIMIIVDLFRFSFVSSKAPESVKALTRSLYGELKARNTSCTASNVLIIARTSSVAIGELPTGDSTYNYGGSTLTSSCCGSRPGYAFNECRLLLNLNADVSLCTFPRRISVHPIIETHPMIQRNS